MESAGDPIAPGMEPGPRRQKRQIRWGRWILASVLLAAAVIAGYSRFAPVLVDVASPESQTVAETIASSGVVQGHQESLVGAEVAGIVTDLFVDEGSRVSKGQLLARVQDNVVRQQTEQSRSALESARAVLAQARARPQPSEVRSAAAKVNQAQAALSEQASMLERVKIAQAQAMVTVQQNQAEVERADAAVKQADSRQALAKKTLDRKAALAGAGAVPQSDLDDAKSAYDVAVQDSVSAADAVKVAKFALAVAQDSVRAAAQDIKSAQSTLASSLAQLAGARNDLLTLRSQPHPENVAVAERNVKQAQSALETAVLQARNTDVFAPFDGTVTSIVSRPGTSASTGGILQLVGTGDLEIRLDLDESNLKDIRIGQRAIVTSPIDGIEIDGRVSRTGPQIDATRGTLEVFVVTLRPQAWLRPGQTLNVNIVTVEKVQRLFVPSTAIQREGDQTVLYVLENGHAAARSVELGPALKGRVPVLSGLKPTERVVQNAFQIASGQRLRARS